MRGTFRVKASEFSQKREKKKEEGEKASLVEIMTVLRAKANLFADIHESTYIFIYYAYIRDIFLKYLIFTQCMYVIKHVYIYAVKRFF